MAEGGQHGGIPASVEDTATTSRPKRVRTGCLTCRQRHLKCDEGLPVCVNCRKSNRECKRGLRLNFIDTHVEDPPIIPPADEWQVVFQDESREIASEYRGGLGRYGDMVIEELADLEVKDEPAFDFSGSMLGAPTMAHQQLPSKEDLLPPGGLPTFSDTSQGIQDHSIEAHHQHTSSSTDSTFSTQTFPPPSHSSYSSLEPVMTTSSQTQGFLNTPEEVLFMQVFVEEVGIWMDSLDPHKHVCITH